MIARTLFFLIVLISLSSPLSAADIADLILYNGKVVTVDAQDRVFRAIAVKEGKILKVGALDDILPLAGLYCKMIDLKGKTVTPGLIDSHYHLMYYGAQFWPGYLNIRAPIVESKSDLLAVLSDHVKTLQPGQWISANQGFSLKPLETLDRHDIDAVAPLNPAYLRHSSGQYSVVNTAALTIAGISSTTPNPPSSMIMKDSTGQPNGILSHYGAENLVAQHATGYGDRSDAQKLEDIKVGQNLCLQAGYTSVQDVIIGSRKDMGLYRQFADSGLLKVRMYMMLLIDTEQEADSMIKAYQPFKSGRLKFGGWKLAQDGGIAAGTCLMYDKTQFGASISYPYHDQATLNRIVKKLHDTGEQVAVHVSGDQGIDMTLTAFENAIQANPRPDPRHRIEHGLFPMTSALQRMKDYGIILSTQPQWIVWFGDGYNIAFNEEVVNRLLPFKTMYDMGVHLAFGCDVPASKYQEPNWAFMGAIMRRTGTGTFLTQSEKLTAKEALRVHTLGSAYAGFAENETGSLEPGKFADMVVWSKDLFTMSPGEIQDFRAEMTIVEGEVLYDAGTVPAKYAPGHWTAAGSLLENHRNHTATLLNNGQVLLAGWSSQAELYDPTTGTFTATGKTLKNHIQGCTATLLQDGRVLLVGGSNAQKNAEIYDPATGLFTLVDTLLNVHSYHTATLLPDGRVLIAAGQDNVGPQTHNVAEIYDPLTGHFTLTGNLLTDRSGHTATLLPNGQVLIAGGVQTTSPGLGNFLSSCELYDPVSGTFRAAADLGNARSNHTATLLLDGRVLIIGSAWNNKGELYDYKSDTWSLTAPMNTPKRTAFTSTLLPSGKVLISGGLISTTTRSAEVFLPENNTFWFCDSMITPHQEHTATLLADGRVLVAGGYALSNTTKLAEIFSVNPAGVVHVESGDHDLNKPAAFTLMPNYPNPFNPVTHMRYKIGASAQVRISIYNMLGEKIITVLDDVRQPGEYQVSWNGVDESGAAVASGVYFVKMDANRQMISRKILLLR